MQACGQGCPRTKVPCGPGTRCSPEAMGRDAGAGHLRTSIPPGWVPSLVRGHPCPHLLCTSQQSHLFGERPSGAWDLGQAVRGGLTSGVASNGRLRARMPADQSDSRPAHTLLSRGDREGGGAGLLRTSIPPGWNPSLVRGHPCPHLLYTSQQSHLFGDGFSDGCARGQPVRGCLTAGVASDGSLRARMPADQSDSRIPSQPVWRSAPIDQSTGIGASG